MSSMLNQFTEKFGLEWENNDAIKEELSDPEIDTKKRIAICLVNAKLIRQDGIPIPIPVTENFIYVGSIGAAYNSSALKRENITHVLCLSSVIKIMFPHEFIYKRVNMKDSNDFDLLSHIGECFSFIQECKHYNKGRGKILVHCYQGKSRSVAVIMAYMIRFLQMTVIDALASIRTVRPTASPNSGFMTQLESLWEVCTMEVPSAKSSQW